MRYVRMVGWVQLHRRWLRESFDVAQRGHGGRLGSIGVGRLSREVLMAYLYLV